MKAIQTEKYTVTRWDVPLDPSENVSYDTIWNNVLLEKAWKHEIVIHIYKKVYWQMYCPAKMKGGNRQFFTNEIIVEY